MSAAPSTIQTEKPKTEKKDHSDPRWRHEITKFFQEQVEVAYLLGPDIFTVRGKLVAFHRESNHCIVDTPTESVFVRLPLQIRRTRKHAESEQNGSML